MAGDSSLRGMMVQKAIENYNKVIEINPENLNAKTDLGACYAEGTGEPMKGILLLREVVSKNPEHEMAQYNLGMLSVKSGQLDKAIERFTKVLEINPKRSEMYFYLGQIYVSKGEPEKAIGYYESFVKKSNDPQAAQEVKKIISDLKKGKV
jgi:tetratricopeptide (TPR) repeat protein